MRIILATPLYPPDITRSAAYIKELARRFAAEHHEVTIVAYGTLPEQVRGVQIVCTSARRPLPVRVLAFTYLLARMLPGADMLYAENGTSVELPVILASWLTRMPFVLHLGDDVARERARQSRARGHIEQLALSRATRTVIDSPLPRPEILPLEPYPTAAFEQYESSWREHLALLGETFLDIISSGTPSNTDHGTR